MREKMTTLSAYADLKDEAMRNYMRDQVAMWKEAESERAETKRLQDFGRLQESRRLRQVAQADVLRELEDHSERLRANDGAYRCVLM
jgi:hypothetical protein